MNISDWMLKEHRQFVIDKIKAPIMKALCILGNRLLEPTNDNTIIPNTHTLIRIWDKFLAMEDNPGRMPLFQALKKVTVSEQEHDIYYRDRMNVFGELWLEEVLKGNWKPRSLDHPNSCWKVDPNVRGEGYKFLIERYYHKEKYADSK